MSFMRGKAAAAVLSNDTGHLVTGVGILAACNTAEAWNQ
jgi:hypothetical protein